MRHRGVVAALVLLGALLGVWLLGPAPAARSTRTPAEPREPEVIPAFAAPQRMEPTSAAVDDVAVMQAGSEDSTEDGPRHPHPTDATRLRIYRENNLIGAMNQAMDLGRYQELRAINAQYREDYPEDEHVLQEAYGLIADCQEGLSDERQARAREFWKQHRSSQLRRFVRRHCRL